MNLDICDEIAEKLILETNTSERTVLFDGEHDVYTMSFSFTKYGIEELLKNYDYLIADKNLINKNYSAGEVKKVIL